MMGITAQDMTLNFKFPIITHYKWLLGAMNDNQGQTVMDLKFLDYQPTIICLNSQNMPHTSTSLLSPTTSIVARGNQW